ncbi:2-amino-4-hydroxy-6-hydroxymethyldihydropteridine diphosphokinase [Garciella nitratireducens]|uniref:2-amino-4-hydroxy-6- hydroxymethyldihydropteridine diphosphokinase n=1 Tax=Garciella nitratireducens TaxID=218205 RepID=UPI000DE88E79|nr:2-amino-4-hydroxy-6-hydroxymethyldihydropteridine diphosphokinase [Garciella nitratireducens]RBP37041.1 2-amino-4-hydroxy-6-hydroxymethyldihydropteridine diphosphokinase [Garciella nitratireducens]
MSRVFLGLGSNLGNKKQNLQQALEFLKNHPKIEIIKISSYYETKPIGYQNQDWFINMVVMIDTTLNPYALLEVCNTIEKKLKRKRVIRWGPRTIDVDILLYQGYLSHNEKLTIPHPRMTQRAFVMIPLYEIAPNIKINNQPIQEIIKTLEIDGIKKIVKEK